jgi:hypothetical protein
MNSSRIGRRMRRAAIAAALSALPMPLLASAAITAPALELVRIQTARAPSGVWARFDGSFPTEDLIQSPLEIQILVRSLATGAQFFRFELSVGVFEGSSDALLDGFGAEDFDAILAASRPSASARLVGLAPNRIEVVLPPSFPAGEAEAQLFLLYRGERLLSNPMEFVVPEAQP